MSTTLPCCTFVTGYVMPQCSSQAAATCRECWTDFLEHGGVSTVLNVVLKQRYRRMTKYVSFQTYAWGHTSDCHTTHPLLHVAVHFHVRLVHPISRLLQSMLLLPHCLEHLGIHIQCAAFSQDWFAHMFAAMPKRLNRLTLDVGRRASASGFGRPIDWPTHLRILRCRFYCTNWTYSHWYELLTDMPEGLQQAELCFRCIASSAAINDVLQIVQDGRHAPAPGFCITFQLTHEMLMAYGSLKVHRLRKAFRAFGWEVQLR